MNSYIEISKTNLIHNITLFKKLLPDNVTVSAVIKGNAYGHGLKEIAQLLEKKVNYFQLDDVSELKMLRNVSNKKAWLLGHVSHDDISYALLNNCVLGLFDVPQAKKVDSVAQKLNKKAAVHIKIDALLGRQGVLIKDLKEFLSEVTKLKNINIEGIYTHFSDLKDPEHLEHTKLQIKEFSKTLKQIKNYQLNSLTIHACSTSAVFLNKQLDIGFNAVRIGAGMYGLWPSEKLEEKFSASIPLRPVLSWYTTVAQIKILPENFPIGYNRTFITKKETKVAIVPVGYSDGYARCLSNKGHVLIHGHSCPILGVISMNMFVVDITHVSNVKHGDKVVLIGRSGNKVITAADLAALSDTINYEVVSKISPLLPRIIV